MPLKAPSLLQFLLSFWKTSFSLMSGGLSVPSAFAGFYLQNDIARVCFIILAVVSLLVASYLIWSKERNNVLELYGKKVEAETRLAEQSAELAHFEFIVSHRPKLQARVAMEGIHSSGIKIRYTVVNVGETAATITLHEITIMTGSIQQLTSCGCVQLKGGEQKITDIHFHDFDTNFNVHTQGICVKGIIEYIDDIGIKRRTGFLRFNDLDGKGFRPSEDRAAEYED
jgi:hypothetical protein